MSSNLYRLANSINAFIGLFGLSVTSWDFLVGVVGGERRNAGEGGDSSTVGKLNLKSKICFWSLQNLFVKTSVRNI